MKLFHRRGLVTYWEAFLLLMPVIDCDHKFSAMTQWKPRFDSRQNQGGFSEFSPASLNTEPHR